MLTNCHYSRIELKLLFALILTVNLYHSDTLVNALECYCNICGNETTCLTKSNQRANCYRSFQGVFNKDNSTYTLEETFGCLSGGDGDLGHLQCLNTFNKEPLLIKCCGSNNCNVDLSPPTKADGPQWSFMEYAIDQDGNYTPPVDPGPPRYLRIDLTTILLCIVLLLTAALCLMRLCRHRSTSSSQGSICSMKSDLEKFHHDYLHNQHTVGSSSNSTHSCSISYDLCHKVPDINIMNQEVSFMPADLTSGLGERMLNRRTIARAVGSGKTDHVGNGRFGRVFRGEYHGENVAVKAFRTVDQESWERENTIFKTLNHDNIVRFISSEVTSLENGTTEIWMFLEYCELGSLCDYLDHNIIKPEQALKILYSIINGLNYLHEDYQQSSKEYKPSIAHRDIKSKNILMKGHDSCCIADFGHALKKIDEETLDYGKYKHLQVGTIRYMAPEILRPMETLNYRHFSTFAQADLYQYGLILWEVCYRTIISDELPAEHHRLPYDDNVTQNPDLQEMIKVVCDLQIRPPKYSRWSEDPMMKQLAELMVECWRPNPKARMETLGVKKKLSQMYNQNVSTPGYQFKQNLCQSSTNSQIKPYHKYSSDITL